MRRHYLAKVESSAVETRYGWHVATAEVDGADWRVTLSDDAGNTVPTIAAAVVNATYANLNAVNRTFAAEQIEVTHELSKVALVFCRNLTDIGLTVMDGPYISMMPYGLSGLHSLTSVLYTHKAFSAENQPRFACQARRSDCTPDAVRICTTCPVRPESNFRKMLSQARQYLVADTDLYLHGTLHTVKTSLSIRS